MVQTGKSDAGFISPMVTRLAVKAVSMAKPDAEALTTG